MEIKVKHRVVFNDEHAQLITKLVKDGDDHIVWLKRRQPTDPDWVWSYDLVPSEDPTLWYYYGH